MIGTKNSANKNILRLDYIKKQLNDLRGNSDHKPVGSDNQVETVRVYSDDQNGIQEESIIKITPEDFNDKHDDMSKINSMQARPKNFKRCKSNDIVIPQIASCNILADNDIIYTKHKKTFSSGIERNVIIEELFLNDSSSNLDDDTQRLYVS